MRTFRQWIGEANLAVAFSRMGADRVVINKLGDPDYGKEGQILRQNGNSIGVSLGDGVRWFNRGDLVRPQNFKRRPDPTYQEILGKYGWHQDGTDRWLNHKHPNHTIEITDSGWSHHKQDTKFSPRPGLVGKLLGKRQEQTVYKNVINSGKTVYDLDQHLESFHDPFSTDKYFGRN